MSRIKALLSIILILVLGFFLLKPTNELKVYELKPQKDNQIKVNKISIVNIADVRIIFDSEIKDKKTQLKNEVKKFENGKQLITPNLNVYGAPGMCLGYVDSAFGVANHGGSLSYSEINELLNGTKEINGSKLTDNYHGAKLIGRSDNLEGVQIITKK